jgi:DNA adenine methylase
MSLFNLTNLPKPKPFLKWVGGKTQLINEIDDLINSKFLNNDQFSYIEPFVGGGAVLFHILTKFSGINSVIINDLNVNLINAYKLIKENSQELVNLLSEIERKYLKINSEEEKKEFYLAKRDEFNEKKNKISVMEKTVLLLFLNKTCFNGLYRVNKKGLFNVPFGKYKQPNICNTENLLSVNLYLQKVTILQGDFKATLNYAKKPTLFYLDPPYKPINSTSSFTSYSEDNFSDEDQIRLKRFCDKITASGHYFILSNSDVKNYDEKNNFFDEVYQAYNIKRVKAKRSINSKGDQRGEIFELLINNF